MAIDKEIDDALAAFSALNGTLVAIVERLPRAKAHQLDPALRVIEHLPHLFRLAVTAPTLEGHERAMGLAKRVVALVEALRDEYRSEGTVSPRNDPAAWTGRDLTLLLPSDRDHRSSLSLRTGATVRRMEDVADRIRWHRLHAKVNSRYRAALEDLRTVIDIALSRVEEQTPYGDPGLAEINDLEHLYAERAHAGTRETTSNV